MQIKLADIESIKIDRGSEINQLMIMFEPRANSSLDDIPRCIYVDTDKCIIIKDDYLIIE